MDPSPCHKDLNPKSIWTSWLKLDIFLWNYQIQPQRESRRAYGTLVSGVVINLNKIHWSQSQILTITQCSNNPNPNLVQCHPMQLWSWNEQKIGVGGYLIQCQVSSNVALVMKRTKIFLAGRIPHPMSSITQCSFDQEMSKKIGGRGVHHPRLLWP